jgi:hypothetical protein
MSRRAWAMDFETDHVVNTIVELATRFSDGTIHTEVLPGSPDGRTGDDRLITASA